MPCDQFRIEEFSGGQGYRISCVKTPPNLRIQVAELTSLRLGPDECGPL